MSLRLCCPKRRHADREEQYHVKEEEPAKYSWERQRADPSHYQFAKLYGEVVAKLDGHVAGQQFVIDKCKECCILVLDYTASVNIDDCEKCLIVLGPCKGSVFVRDCVSCTIFTISQQFRSRDCSDIDVFLFCSTRPIIESCRLMRFRPLSLSYDQLEEHMLKASISPFINNWSSIHDFTPDETSNFEICPMAYDTIENMELVNNLEKVKFSAELSFFPLRIPSDEIQQKVYLILCKQLSSESIEEFYRRAVIVQRELIAAGAKVLATRDVLIRKGEMHSIFESKQISEYSGRIVSIEAACEMAMLRKICEAEGGAIELVGDENFMRYRTSLYRLAEVQMEV